MGTAAEIGLPLVLAFMMLTLGLGLTFADFRRVFTRPKAILIGLVMQILLLPLVGFLLINVFSVSTEIAVGVMLIAVAPGGVTSNYLTALALGEVALSVSLTAITSLLSILTVPAILTFAIMKIGLGTISDDISFVQTAISIFLIVTLPVLLGMVLRRVAETLVIKMERPAQVLSTVFLILVLAGAIFQQRENAVSYFVEAGMITLTLNVIMMALSYLIAKSVQCDPAERIAICMECGLQNGTLAIAIGVMLFGGGAYLIPAATYSLIMFGTSLAFLWLARTRLAR